MPEGPPGSRGQSGNLLQPLGTVQRQSVDRAASIAFSACGSMLAVLSAGKALELFKYGNPVHTCAGSMSSSRAYVIC